MTGPIDYIAACGAISVCVFVPPVLPGINLATIKDNTVIVEDPLLSPPVCGSDGGSVAGGSCYFTYFDVAALSVFPGSPPAMQSAVSCPPANGFTTLIDPLGAAKINFPSGSSPMSTSGPTVCAVDLHVPAS
jgi:hypothetical protein